MDDDPEKALITFYDFLKYLGFAGARLAAGPVDLNALLKKNGQRIVVDIFEEAGINAALGMRNTLKIDPSLMTIRFPDSMDSKRIYERIPGSELRPYPPILANVPLNPGEIGIGFIDEDSVSYPEGGNQQIELPYSFFKYNLPPALSRDEAQRMREVMGIKSDRKIWVVASPSTKEIESVTAAFDAEPKDKKPLVVFGIINHSQIVPFKASMTLRGYRALLRSNEDKKSSDSFNGLAEGQPMGEADIIFLSTDGELRLLFAAADIAIVGRDRNIMEPVSQERIPFYFPGAWTANGKILQFLKERSAAEEIVDLSHQVQERLRNQSLKTLEAQRSEKAIADFKNIFMPANRLLASTLIAEAAQRSSAARLASVSKATDTATINAQVERLLARREQLEALIDRLMHNNRDVTAQQNRLSFIDSEIQSLRAPASTQASGARLAVVVPQDKALDFLQFVFSKMRQSGRIVIDSDLYELHVENNELVITGFGGELLRTKKWKNVVTENTDAGSPFELSLPDAQLLLKKSFNQINDIPIDPALNQIKALGSINLDALNPDLKGFNEIILLPLLEELNVAHHRPDGRNAKFLLIGNEKVLQLATAELAKKFKSGQDFILTDETLVSADYKKNSVFMTTPENARPDIRNFYVQTPKEGDFLNLRGMIRFSLALARIRRLSTTDPQFMQVKAGMELLLGHSINDVKDFIEAIEAISSNRVLYALPALFHATVNAALQAARLAVRMSAQSA
jgi:hypothetical protein